MAALREALGQWLSALAALRAERSKRGLVASVDGKALRGIELSRFTPAGAFARNRRGYL